MHSLGINIGSTSIKAVMLEGDGIIWHEAVPHEGDFPAVLKKILAAHELPADLMTLATGTEGRFMLSVNNVIESLCVEEALFSLDLKPDAVVSLGGEDLVVYTLGQNGKIVNTFSGNKCASGTGEFFKQQLGRMNMDFSAISSLGSACVHRLSCRCSVFMKSDCTHKLNKGEATKEDIVLSLSDVMATKVADFLKRGRISKGRIVLTGGVTLNPYIRKFINERLPLAEIIIPEQAAWFEAFGAAHLAVRYGSILPSAGKLFHAERITYERYAPFIKAQGRVKRVLPVRGKARPGGEYLLGVDGGSTTTKACLIDIDTREIVACHYGRTHGDPVAALKHCLVEIRKQMHDTAGEGNFNIAMASVTGSSREILGVFLETPAVYNEIIAHSRGAAFFCPEIDTIFEIGGQDAKYVLLKNGVPIDYAMNEACSAGTGSFLEESAQGDLNIKSAPEIGPIALQAKAPLKFGEHCSAFINSDIRKAVQQGASREDITAGIIASVVANYLNRVVGNRTIGNSIVLQGGVAKNEAVPLAFAMLLEKDITVPPDPELLGCFGVALLALEKLASGDLEKTRYQIAEILNREIASEKEFTCKACSNFCPIRVLKVNNHPYMFGGRCNKYANLRRKTQFSEETVHDFIADRLDLLFVKHCPNPAEIKKQHAFRVGIPRAFSVHTLMPFYSWFFHELGIETFLTKNISREGTARMESAYCFPSEIAHGAVQDAIDHQADYIFVPHFKDMPSYEKNVHANFCPITQAFPYYIRQAFPEIPQEKFLTPVVSFKFGVIKAREAFIQMGTGLGIAESETDRAFDTAMKKQEEYLAAYKKLGITALEHARKSGKPAIAVLGRPYNAFTPEANMGIPRKFTTRGFSVLPFDILPFENEVIFPNMYWYYGQQDMKAAVYIKNEKNIFCTYITNFSCAPDSFMLHYVRWIMGSRPFLILEFDSHSADAGIDTRVEAFLDIIEGYRKKVIPAAEEKYDNGLLFNAGNDGMFINNIHTGESIPVKNNPRVKMLLASMGRLTTEFVAAVFRGSGVAGVPLPVPDIHTLQRARDYASGKECVPSLLVLGGALQFFASEQYRKDEIYLLFVPITTGPCRTGQYFVYYENLFRDLRLENVVLLILSSDNSYSEVGPNFSKNIWWSMAAADYMKDIEISLRTCARDSVSALKRFDEIWKGVLSALEKDASSITPVLKKAGWEIAKIPLARKPDVCPKVLVVGEIYVRRDDFTVDEIISNLARKGIIAKISGVAEWIYYCDFVREFTIKKKLSILPWYKKFFSPVMKDLLVFKIEQWYKHYADRKIKNSLRSTGLIPSAPHDMHKIMHDAYSYYVTSEMHSEISISSGAAWNAMHEGYSGVINISPFACLIGRVIEGIITPHFRKHGYPVLSVEIDGNSLPPAALNKLDIFMMNAMRLHGKSDTRAFIEKPK